MTRTSGMRTSACLSRLGCDQLLNGELDELEAGFAHAASCARCSALLDEHRRERAAFAIPLRQRAARRASTLGVRQRAARWWPAVVAVAVCAAAAVVMLVPRVESTRDKGAPVLGFYLKRGAAIHRGGAGELVATGDVLDFTVASPVPAFVAVISVDGAHQVSAYYPAGPLAAAVGAGEQLLPLAVRLDGVLGVEQLHGLFCDHPAAVADLIAAVDRGEVPAGCASDTLTIEKR